MSIAAVLGPWAKATREVAADVAREWRTDRVTGLGAEIAFFGLLSVFPALLACSAALHWLERLVGQELADRAQQATVELLERVLSDEGSPTIAAVEHLFEEPNTGVLSFGILGALWSVSRGFAAVIRGLDLAYDIDERRTWVGRRVTAFGLGVGTVLVSLLVLAVLVLGPLLGGGTEAAEALHATHTFAVAWAWLRLPTTALLVTAWTTLVFHFGPFERTAWRWHVPGAVLATASWLGATVGLRLYLGAGLGGNEVFGVIGGGLTLVFWLYLLALGLLTGGELNAVLASRKGVVPTRPALDPGRWMAHQARRAGNHVATRARRRS